jgi:hypothetical protein
MARIVTYESLKVVKNYRQINRPVKAPDGSMKVRDILQKMLDALHGYLQLTNDIFLVDTNSPVPMSK